MRTPNFENLLKVLRRECPDRPTLFELFMNRPLYERLAGRPSPAEEDAAEMLRFTAEAYAAAGYDYATTHGSSYEVGWGEVKLQRHRKDSISLNEGYCITDWQSFERYHWNDPANYDYSKLQKAAQFLPQGMKLMVMGPGGVLENVISLVGFDNLCMMLYDQPELAKEIFDRVGAGLLGYYENCVEYDSVGLLCSNDDWGFNTQTFLSPQDMRKYVFPWHKKIVELAHRHHKPCILHSCGYFEEMMAPVAEELCFDGKHSYEDNILPVEECYERWHESIAILGGIDVNFIIRATPQEIKARSRAMLERTAQRGGYALGTGNSVPEYIPQENYLAMVEVVNEW